jgi:hypothetical protein
LLVLAGVTGITGITGVAGFLALTDLAICLPTFHIGLGACLINSGYVFL